MATAACAISPRSEFKRLPPFTAGAGGIPDIGASSKSIAQGAKGPGGSSSDGPVVLLEAEAKADWPRLIELSGSAPFDAWIGWLAGKGRANTVQVSVPRGTRVCVIARALKVIVVNRSKSANDVVVCVSDQYADTRNQWEFQGDAARATCDVPPFAQSVSAQSTGGPSAAVVEIVNGFGTTVRRFKMNTGPHPIGGADAVKVGDLAVGELFTLQFGLGL